MDKCKRVKELLKLELYASQITKRYPISAFLIIFLKIFRTRIIFLHAHTLVAYCNCFICSGSCTYVISTAGRTG